MNYVARWVYSGGTHKSIEGPPGWLRDTLRRVINESTNSNGASESVRHTEGTAMDTIPTIQVGGPTALIGGTDCKPRRSSSTSVGASS